MAKKAHDKRMNEISWADKKNLLCCPLDKYAGMLLQVLHFQEIFWRENVYFQSKSGMLMEKNFKIS